MGRIIDLAGLQFGMLTVLRLAPKNGSDARWVCRCLCGKQTVAISYNLKSGHTTSCGCRHFEKRYPRDDLVGKRFGMLQVITFAGRKGGDSLWSCQCDCGVIREKVSGYNLRSGNSRSCGCQIRVGLRRANFKHGLTGSVEYKIWAGMHSRCYNEKEKTYKYYGAKGITICARWRGRNGFVNFISDMGNRPSKNYWIERKDGRKGYSPTNCYWATRIAQANNKSTTRWVICDGKCMSLTQACRAMGLSYGAVYTNMRRKGLSFAQAAALPRRVRIGGRYVWVESSKKTGG